MRGVKQIHDQLNSVEEMLMVQPLPPLSANQISSRQQQHHGGKNQRNAKNPISASDVIPFKTIFITKELNFFKLTKLPVAQIGIEFVASDRFGSN